MEETKNNIDPKNVDLDPNNNQSLNVVGQNSSIYRDSEDAKNDVQTTQSVGVVNDNDEVKQNQSISPITFGNLDTKAINMATLGGAVNPPATKRPVLFVVLMAVTLLVICAAFATSLFLKTKNAAQTDSSLASKQVWAIEKMYDSPIGLIRPFQEKDIKSGKYKIIADYATGEQFEREGDLSVTDEGQIALDVLPDSESVNKLIDYLYEKNGVTAKYGADRYFTFDFATLNGYQYLYESPYEVIGGYIARAEQALGGAASIEESDAVITDSCSTDLERVKSMTSVTSLNTVNLSPQLMLSQEKWSVVIPEDSYKDTDSAISAFLASCFDDNGSSNSIYSQISSVPYDQPIISIWQDQGNEENWHITIGSKSDDSLIEIMVWGLSENPISIESKIGSYGSITNKFGLAYSLCRVTPVAYSDFAASFTYSFIGQDNFYGPPSGLTKGYACRTLDVPDGFRPGPSMTLDFEGRATLTAYDDEDIAKFRAFHDLSYEIEQYYIENNVYPAENDVIQLAQNLGKLQESANLVLTDKTLVYSASPKECTTNCASYELSYLPVEKVRMTKSAYDQ